MATLSWYPEPVPPLGAFKGFRAVLGRPRLHPLTILVRETAQNSWDARLDNRRQVKFSVSGYDLTDKQIADLRTKVFSELPPDWALPLRNSLARTGLRALVIRDTGTHGLGGPVRADAAEGQEANRYVRFLLDMGVGQRSTVDGGTYGFGRSIVYNTSAAYTVVVYTRTGEGTRGVPETRLICAALGDAYSEDGRNYTGRHWWGKVNSDSVEPLTGTRADQLAESIGLTPFAEQERGTAIMIIDPVLHTPDPEQAMAFIAETITWHLWPKMLKVKGRAPMSFSVTWNGRSVRVPEPTDLRPLGSYARILEVLREANGPGCTADGVEIIEIRAQKPRTLLGLLGVHRFPFHPRRPPAVVGGDENGDSPQTPAAPLSANSSHVVLLRRPQLVVTYQEYPPLADRALEWAGVFLAADEHNEAFAMAEPPTHDDWLPQNVPDAAQKRISNIALREIKAAVNARFSAVSQSPPPPGDQSVAVVASELGGLLLGTPGQGPSTPGGTERPPGRGRGRQRLRITGSGPLLQGQRRLAAISFEIDLPEGELPVHLEAGVAVGDGRAIEGEERPAAAPVPVLVSLDHDGTTTWFPPGTTSTDTRLGAGRYRLLASAPDDVLVALLVEEAPEQGDHRQDAGARI